MAQNITLQGASYSDVPSVSLPKTGGGTTSFTDVTGTTAAAADVASGKYFFTAEGVLTLGTSSGGGGGSVTQDSNGYIVLPETGGGGGGSTGLVYESGTWTPSEDIAKGEILFANTHSTLPILVCLVDATGTYDDTLYTNIQFMYCNYYSIGGNPLYIDSTSLRYGFVQYIYRNTNATSWTNSYTDLVTSPSDSRSTLSNQTRYHVDEAGFYPNTISTTRYWRSGRTYKWVAVWAPTS